MACLNYLMAFPMLMMLLLSCSFSCAIASSNASVDVICSTIFQSSCKIIPSKWVDYGPVNKGQIASAWFYDTYNETGWAHLEVATYPAAHINFADVDSLQAYAAGLAEGYLTAAKVSQHFSNTFVSYWGQGPVPQPFVDYIETNLAYMLKQSDSLGSSDSFWRQVGLILKQMRGVLDGANQALAETSLPQLSFFDIMISNIGEYCFAEPSAAGSLHSPALQMLK